MAEATTPQIEAVSTPKPPPTPPGVATPRQMEIMKQWARDLGIALVVAWIIITFLFQQVGVEGTSMMPRLMDGDHLFINKFVYRFGEMKRGDVVVFLYPGDHTKSYIKRVIGVPGDDVRESHGHVYVNGEQIAEPYVQEIYRDDRSFDDVIVPQGDLFVMGDHRSISNDSRDFGPIDRKLIYGKAAYVYWPIRDSGTVR